jgi:hypothetical protein
LPIGSKWSLIAKAIVNLAPPNQCAPSASRSFPQFLLHPDRQFAHTAEPRHTHLTGNLALYLREVVTFLLSAISAACVVFDVQVLSTLRPRSLPIGVPGVETEAATRTPGMLILCLWLSMNCLLWFVGLIPEGVGEVRSWLLLHKRICACGPERRFGSLVSWRIP